MTRSIVAALLLTLVPACVVFTDTSEIEPADVDDTGVGDDASGEDVDGGQDLDEGPDVDGGPDDTGTSGMLPNPCGPDRRESCAGENEMQLLCIGGIPTLQPCASSCVQAGGEAVCPATCQPGDDAMVQCQEDFVERVVCNESGPDGTTDPCMEGQICRGGPCVLANTCSGSHCVEGDLEVCDADGTTRVTIDCGDDAPCTVMYPDTDGDGQGDAEADAVVACGDPPDGFSLTNNDCDDDDMFVFEQSSDAEVWYDGVDQDCSGGSDYDQDGDGTDLLFSDGEIPTDCDDTNSDVNDRAIEIADDGIDNDCDGFDLRTFVGPVMIGSPESEPDRQDIETEHPITLSYDVEVMLTEVTQARWQAVVATEFGDLNPAYFGDCPNCPIERINWYEVLAFANLMSEQAELEPCFSLDPGSAAFGGGCGDSETCSGGTFTAAVALNGVTSVLDCEGYRLPTEAEWEWLARAGDEGRFPGGSLDAIAWHPGTLDEPMTEEVGQKLPNAFGLHDVIGNVAEWTQDVYAGFDLGGGYMASDTPIADPVTFDRSVIDPSAIASVRGGAFNQGVENLLRVAKRAPTTLSTRSYTIGFRLVRTVPID